MPRILMINTVCSGSHGRLMRDLADAAATQGFETRIAFGRGASSGAEAERFDRREDVLLHVLLTRALDRHAKGSRAATARLLAIMDAYAPDIVHLHNVHGYYLHAPLLFEHLKKRETPTIWTQHDCWALTGHCSHFVRADCMRWQTGCYRCPLKHAYPASYGLDASAANWRWKREAFASLPSLRIVSPSQWLSDTLGMSYLRDVPRLTIPNGVDLALFAPASGDALRARYGIAPSERLLLAVAAPFDERKGFSDMLALARLLEGRARVMMVGLTGKQAAALPPGILGVTHTQSPQELVSMYNAADCLVNPTYEDTYPTVNMEAMACGTPVAGYSVGGAREQLQPPFGAGVAVGDVQALAQAAMATAEEKEALSAACRQYALTNFDRKAAMAQYLALYNETINAR